MANQFSVAVPNALEALMLGQQGYEKQQLGSARRLAGQALQTGGNAQDALARLLEVGDIQGANALANFGNQGFERQYKQGVLDIARQTANRQEVPAQLQVLKAAGINPASAEGRKALFPRTDTPISATDKKAIFEAEDAVPQIKGTIENLNRALELNPKTFTGLTAGLRGEIGTKVPGGGMLVDKNAALATSEWQKIMGPEALQTMANTLKGATTDFELRKFIEMLGDPSVDPGIRKGVIERLKRLAERKLEIQESRTKDLRGGTYFKPQGETQGAVDPLSKARDAIAKGAPREAVIQRLQQSGIDPSGL